MEEKVETVEAKPDFFPLLKETDVRLKKTIPEYKEEENLDLHRIAAGMHHTRNLYKAVGLAANQVGLPIRMFVMGTAFAEFTCINPEILQTSVEKEKTTEGCLSFPRLVLAVDRPKKIKVRYFDVDLKEVECEFEGLFARCFQHELDHLNGITFTEKVSKLVLAMARKKQQRTKRFR